MSLLNVILNMLFDIANGINEIMQLEESTLNFMSILKTFYKNYYNDLSLLSKSSIA